MFRRRGNAGGGGGGLEDDMTIGSATSVSDRIMGRMKRNLSFGGSSSKNNVSSAGSVSSSKSGGRFGRKKKQSYRSGSDWESVQSNGSSRRSLKNKSKSTSRFMNSSINSSAASVTTMEEMDSNEAMTLRGISMGRRHAPSAPIIRQPSKEEEGESRVIDEPVEMSLAELRSMSEPELEQSMLKAGVPSEDISRTKDEVMKLDIDSNTADEKRRGSLVALFVNSGHVRLIQTDRRSTLSSSNTNSMKSVTDIAANTNTSPRENTSAPINASASVASLESKSISRKSKLEKIAELQGEKSSLKKENKALKKTMKNLLVQLSESAKERKALKKEIESYAKEKRKSDSVEDSAKGSLHSVDPDISVATDKDSKANQRKESRDGSGKEINSLKKLIKKQQQEHESTEFRLKTEIEILTKEVDGLQRELSLSLESIDDAEKRVIESQETASKLKRKMRTMSSKLNNLVKEADARDKLIETFTKILVDNNCVENGEAVLEGKIELAQLIQS